MKTIKLWEEYKHRGADSFYSIAARVVCYSVLKKPPLFTMFIEVNDFEGKKDNKRDFSLTTTHESTWAQLNKLDDDAHIYLVKMLEDILKHDRRWAVILISDNLGWLVNRTQNETYIEYTFSPAH